MCPDCKGRGMVRKTTTKEWPYVNEDGSKPLRWLGATIHILCRCQRPEPNTLPETRSRSHLMLIQPHP